MPDDGDKVRVTIHCRAQWSGPRSERRGRLEQAFSELDRQVVRPAGGALLSDSLSVSGQTVDAELPAARLRDVEVELEGRGYRVDRALMHQVVPPF